jgi:hypothetical protein
MPHRAEQSLADGVSVRKKTPGLWFLSRVMMYVLDGVCLPVFVVFYVMRFSSGGLLSCNSTSCCSCGDYSA